MLGDRINYLRKEKGVTLKQLGEVLKLGESTVSMYENNKRNPDYDTLIKIANFFHCSTDYLLEKTDDPTPYHNTYEDTELTPKERLKELFQHPKIRDKELAFKDFDSMDDEDIESIIEYVEARYLLAEKRKNDNK